jgi:inner membrane transporter RhtA
MPTISDVHGANGLRKCPAVLAGRQYHRPLPPHLYFVVSAVFHYLGPSFAVLLFARVAPLGVAWLRIASAALVFAAWRRPWRALSTLQSDGRRLLLAWGVVLALMNACFYTAIDHLPLATVAAIEFVPVVAMAALGARTARNVAAVVLAAAGAYALTDVRLVAHTLGITFAFLNAGLFAAYIVLADRVAKRPGLSGIDGLGLAMILATVVITPIGGEQALRAAGHPGLLAAGIGVGVCSSVIPYVTDQLALRRLSRATYALLISLLPVVAAIIGLVVLAQLPTLLDCAGIALVVGGIALHRDPAPTPSKLRRDAPKRVRHSDSGSASADSADSSGPASATAARLPSPVPSPGASAAPLPSPAPSPGASAAPLPPPAASAVAPPSPEGAAVAAEA